MELGVSHVQNLSSLTPNVDNIFDKYNKNLVPIRSLPDHDTNKQVPVLNFTETSITLQADLQDAFQYLCLCSHGGKESTEDQSTE